jgi:hypothetical protein
MSVRVAQCARHTDCEMKFFFSFKTRNAVT